MSAKSIAGASLLGLLLASVAVAQVHPPTVPPGVGSPVPGSVSIDASAPPTLTAVPAPIVYPTDPSGRPNVPTGAPGVPGVGQDVSPTPDSWITYPQNNCCGPVGDSGPLMMEVYFRVGTVSPVGGSTMDRALRTGWGFEVGGRSLFFNPERDRAWTVDLGLGNAANTGSNTGVLFNQTTNGNQENVFLMNRTWGSIGVGQEYYLLGPASYCASGACNDGACNNLNWRAGWDVDARYGTVRINGMSQTTGLHTGHNSRLFGTALAAHSDIELPRGCCTYLAGIRLEYSYDWISAYGSQSNFGALSVLYTIGVRF